MRHKQPSNSTPASQGTHSTQGEEVDQRPAIRCFSREMTVHCQPARHAGSGRLTRLHWIYAHSTAAIRLSDTKRPGWDIGKESHLQLDTAPWRQKHRPPGIFQPACGWSRRESNPLPPHCERGALPNELRPQHQRTTTHVFLTRNNRSQTTGTLNRKLNSMASFSAGTMLLNRTALLNSTAPQNNKASQNNDGPGTHRRLRIHTSNSDRLVQVLVHQWSRYSSTRSTDCP